MVGNPTGPWLAPGCHLISLLWGPPGSFPTLVANTVGFGGPWLLGDKGAQTV